jgi:imidazolonepropionase-like amidohydrolase
LTGEVKPTEDEIRAAVEETAKKFKLISLAVVGRASDLRPFMGADAWQVDHIAGLSEEQEDEIAGLEELLHNYGDIWTDISPTERREAVKTIFESISRLQSGGLCVAMGLDEMRLIGPGSAEGVPFEMLRVVVSSASQPQLTAFREKDRPMQFV